MTTPGPTAERLSLLFDLGRWADLKRAAVEAFAARPADLLAREYLAVAHWHLGEYPGALGLIEGVLALDPRRAYAHRLRGWVLRDLGDPAGALAAALESLRLAPASTDSLELLATLRLDRGEPAEARGACRRALELDPSNVGVLLKLARADWAEHQLDAALWSLRQALELGPTNASVHWHLAQCHRMVAEAGGGAAPYRLAAAHAARATALNPNWAGHREQWDHCAWHAQSGRRGWLSLACLAVSLAFILEMLRQAATGRHASAILIPGAGMFWAFTVGSMANEWPGRRFFAALPLPRPPELSLPMEREKRFAHRLAWAVGPALLAAAIIQSLVAG